MNKGALARTWIKTMEESDLDEVLLIEASSGLTSWSRQSFQWEMENALSSCFVLRGEAEGNTPITGFSSRGSGSWELTCGFICFRILGEESELLNLGIHPEYRRGGLGRALVAFYLDFCDHRRVKTFYLETAVSRSSTIRLYRSFDFKVLAVRPGCYQGGEDAFLMMRATRC